MKLGKFLGNLFGGSTSRQQENEKYDPEEIMAICRDAHGDWETQAATCLIAATLVEDDETKSEAHYLRGNALEELDRYDEAIAEYDQSIELTPTFVDAIVNRGLAYRRIDDLTSACRDYELALGIDPDHRPARMNLAFVALQVDDFAVAKTHLDHLLAIDPDDVFALYNRSVAHSGMGNPEAAIQDLDRAIEVEPENADLWFQRAQCRVDLGLHENAKLDLQALVARMPDDAEAHFELARLLAQGDETIRDQGTALVHQQIGVHLQPDDLEQRHGLAIIATWAGEVDIALSEWEFFVKEVGMADKFQAELVDKGYLSESDAVGDWNEACQTALAAYAKDGRIPLDET